MNLLKEINKAANDYNRTKDIQFKDKWYRLIKKFNENYNTVQAKSAAKLSAPDFKRL